jgi:glycosyltransferase involved in cell wall biosynthesis
MEFDKLTLPPDLYTRNFIIAKAIEEYKTIHRLKNVKILDVGGRRGKMSLFLDSNDKLDILDIRPGEEPNLIIGNGINMQMFPDNFYDVVISSDVFEHIIPNKRNSFIDESLRVSKGLVILAAPFKSRSTEKVEKIANQFFKDLTGKEHEWLREHINNSLPESARLEQKLNQSGWNFTAQNSNNLNNWLLFQLVIFFSYRFGVKKDLLDSFYKNYNRHFTLLENPAEPTYRKIYFITKKFFSGPKTQYAYNPEKQLHFTKSAFQLIAEFAKEKIKEKTGAEENPPVLNKVFIVSEACDGSHYYRAEVFRRYSKKYAVRTNFDYRKGIQIDNYRLYKELFSSDIVIFSRPTNKTNLELVDLLKNLGKIVIADNDDLFAKIDKSNPAFSIRKNYARLNRRYNRLSDSLVVPTKCLKEELKKDNRRVYVVPNYIDFDEYRQFLATKNKKPNDGKVRMLVSGSVLTRENVNEGFVNLLRKIHLEYPQIVLVFFGGDIQTRIALKKFFPTRIECWKGVVMSEYPAKLAYLNIDFCIIPRKNNFFNRCKSNCKFLEMAALKIPVIAQSFGDRLSPYEKDIKDGVNGLLAVNNNEWEKKIILLVKSQGLRDKIANQAYLHVKNHFDIKIKISRWEEALDKIVNSSQTDRTPATFGKTVGLSLVNFVHKIAQNGERDKLAINQLESKINRLENKIFAMQSSKFWQLRNRYLKIKGKFL